MKEPTKGLDVTCNLPLFEIKPFWCWVHVALVPVSWGKTSKSDMFTLALCHHFIVSHHTECEVPTHTHRVIIVMVKKTTITIHQIEILPVRVNLKCILWLSQVVKHALSHSIWTKANVLNILTPVARPKSSM